MNVTIVRSMSANVGMSRTAHKLDEEIGAGR